MNDAQYQQLYQHSIESPETFWAEQAQSLTWHKPFTEVLSGSLAQGDVRWFADGELNACVNCVDRHLAEHGDKTAIIWEADEQGHSQRISFADLHTRICRFANVLKQQVVTKGDRVCLYMPMIPEAAVSMLACARIGAVHSVVFGGFSPESIRSRIQDAHCHCVITADTGYRGGRMIPFKANVDQAVAQCDCVETVLVIRHTGEKIDWIDNRDVDYQLAAQTVSADCPATVMSAEDPLFILYTSGSTGSPKGVLHTTGGYLLYASLTHRTVFGIEHDDVYWCTADVGWITGHSYIVYGPLANATTTLMFEGTPNYPDVSRFWHIVDTHAVNVFYTAPTAIRALMAHGNASLQSTHRQSLRVLGSVGEPINPEAWQWYFDQVGQKRCPTMDTWWQTETGGFMIAPPFAAQQQKPGAAMRPFFGIQPVLADTQGKELAVEAEGDLLIKYPWPGMMRTVYGDHQRFMETYLSAFPGYYCSGDGAKRDADGDIWITGRTDDVLNVSVDRLGTAEIEIALVLHEAVAEAAIVGIQHAIKGEGIYTYVTLVPDAKPTDDLKRILVQLVRQHIGPIATIDTIQWTEAVPKTRSGKIMRRLLRKIATGQYSALGDTSTLANPDCIDALIADHQALKAAAEVMKQPDKGSL